MPYIYVGAQAFLAGFVFLVGTTFAKHKVKTFPLWGIGLSLAITFIGSFYWRCEFGSTSYSFRLMLPYLVTAVLATWSFYSLFTRIKENKTIIATIATFIGSNTLTILTWHFLMFKLTSLLIIWIYDLPIERLAEFPVIKERMVSGYGLSVMGVNLTINFWWLCYFLTAMFTTCGIAYCNKYIKSSWWKV